MDVAKLLTPGKPQLFGYYYSNRPPVTWKPKPDSYLGLALKVGDAHMLVRIGTL